MKTKRRLAIFLPSLRGGGVERVMLTLAEELFKSGNTVDLVLANAEGEYLKDVPDGVNIVNFDKSRVLFCVLALAKYLRNNNPTALLSAMGHANIVAVWAKVVSGSKARVVLSEHTLSISKRYSQNKRGRILPIFQKIFYPLAHRVVAVSAGVKEDLINELGLSKNSIEIINNPIRIAIADDSVCDEVHPWLRNAEVPVVVAAGRLTRVKDFPVLIEATSIVAKSCDLRLIILGEGEDRSRLTDLVEATGLTNIVDMPGFVGNPFSYFSRASLFVLSSSYEGFGNVLVEAMACGTPVVSTNCPGGPPEILENGRYGRLVPVGDAEAMARAITRSLAEGPDRDALRSRASDFAAEKIAKKYEQILAA